MFSTPILLIAFNRPDHTRLVLTEIVKAAPKDLFVFQDGARNDCPEDVEKCQKVRRVVEELTSGLSGLSTHFYYSDTNLGCGPGPAAALAWFFDQVESGIIFEDDAVPHPDFFSYAGQLLERYKDDSSVCAIGSMNVDAQRWGDSSYYFSMMNRNLCAWATWRRAWQRFDLRLMNTSRRQLSRALRYYKCGVLEREYWCDRLDEVHKNGCEGKSWDIQFFMSIWLNGGKGIIPSVNLSSNIGTVGEATHSMAAGNIIDNVPTRPVLPLVYPVDETVQYEADRQFHFLYFEPWKRDWSVAKKAYYLVNKRIKRLVGHQGPWIKRK